MLRTCTAALAFPVVCLCLVACGSSGSNTGSSEELTPQQYKQTLGEVGKHESEAHKAVEGSLGSGSPERVAKALTAFAEDQEERAEELASVTPPKNAQAAHSKLETALKDSAAALNELVPEVEKANSAPEVLATIQKATASQEAGKKLDSALAELKKLGYTKGS
jgi:hypothetical protein